MIFCYTLSFICAILASDLEYHLRGFSMKKIYGADDLFEDIDHPNILVSEKSKKIIINEAEYSDCFILQFKEFESFCSKRVYDLKDLESLFDNFNLTKNLSFDFPAFKNLTKNILLDLEAKHDFLMKMSSFLRLDAVLSGENRIDS